MNSITQDMRFRLSIVKFYNRISATKTAIRYKVTRQFIYFWVYRFNGDIHSLADHSHRPHHHPNQHTDTEIKWIKPAAFTKLWMKTPKTTEGICIFFPPSGETTK